MTKIYDCFTFFNEFELLELRLRELYDHVDYFVLVEANKTFQNNDKPYHYQENKEKFKIWHDKIIHVQVDNMPADTDTWGRERFQRDQILSGLTHTAQDDIIMIGDVDEIPRLETIQKLKSSVQNVWGFRMPLFNFKLNYMLYTNDFYSIWSGAIRRSLLDSPEDFRRMRHMLNQFTYSFGDDNVQIIEHAGWHFTYFGDEQFITTKLQSYAHQEANTPENIEQLNVNQSIENGVGVIQSDSSARFVPVLLDDYFPQSVKNNPNKYKDVIINTASKTVKDILPFE
jgi:hypothetical protein